MPSLDLRFSTLISLDSAYLILITDVGILDLVSLVKQQCAVCAVN